MLVVVSATNAVNLTDGIDGLCGTVSFVVTLFFLVAAGITGYFGMSLASAAFAGALAGFLVWNLHPAKVFMGDTGSLMSGACSVRWLSASAGRFCCCRQALFTLSKPSR